MYALNALVVKLAPPTASSLSQAIFLPTTEEATFTEKFVWSFFEISCVAIGLTSTNEIVPSIVVRITSISSFPAGLTYEITLVIALLAVVGDVEIESGAEPVF